MFRNLVHEWLAKHKDGKFYTNLSDLQNIDESRSHHLGIFAKDHCTYKTDRDSSEPSLVEKTLAALKILEKSDSGYFLFVEGGRIDHGHHANLAVKVNSHELSRLTYFILFLNIKPF